MAVSLRKFNTQDAWEYLLSKYSKWHLSSKKKVRSTKDGNFKDEWFVKSAYLKECLEDVSIINENNALFVLEAFFDTRRFWYHKDEDFTPVIKNILDNYTLDQEYIDKTFKNYALNEAIAYMELLWDKATDKCKDEVVDEIKPYNSLYSTKCEKTIVFFENKKFINFKKKGYRLRDFRGHITQMSVETLKQIDFNISDEVIKMFADNIKSNRLHTLNYLFTLSKFRDKVIDNPKWMFYSKKNSWNKFIDHWPLEYQQPYIDQLKEELRLKKLNESPKIKEEIVEEVFVERTEFSREFIESCIPELRKLKQPGFKLFEKDVSNKEIIDSFEMIFKTKSPHTGTMKYEVESEFDFEDLIKDKFSKKFIEKYSKMPFNIKKIRKAVIKEASKLVGLSPNDELNIPTGCYWIQDEDARRIFGANIRNRYLNVSLRSHIISEVIDYVKENRNIDAKLACSYSKEELIGKFVVTENNVLSGFLKNSMTLKYIGYQVGEIKENKYGERHGYDNFWDDSVPNRNFLLIKLENNTGAKELEKKHWKKRGMLYAIDLTKTLHVFDTVEEAREIAAQLNEEAKNSLTLDY